MPDNQVFQHRRAVPEPVNITDVSRILTPEGELRVLTKPTYPLIQLTRCHRAPAANGPLEDGDAVDLTSSVGVALGAQILHVLRLRVLRVVGERRRQVAHHRYPDECVEQILVPALGRLDDIVVKLDEIRLGREREGVRVRVDPDVLRMVHDAKSRVVEHVQIGLRAIGRGVVPDHDLARLLRCSSHDIVDAPPQEMKPIVGDDRDGDHDVLSSDRR